MKLSNANDDLKLIGARCLCSGCGEYFADVESFDNHRRGSHKARICKPPHKVRMTLNTKGFWTTKRTSK